MHRPLLAAAAAALIALVGAPAAYAQPSGTDTADVVPADTPEAPVDPPADPDPEPAPVDPEPIDPAPVDPEPAPVDPEPGTPEPGTPAPGTPVPGTPEPGTPAPGTPAPGTPLPGTPAPGTAAPTGTVAPTEPAPVDPTGTTAPTTSAPTTVIDVDVDIDDHSDHSVHIDRSVTFIVRGDRYSNTYVYRDVRDGRIYRGRDLDCADFDTQADAQAVLDATGTDLYWLDADRDGIACEIAQGEFTRDAFASAGVRRGGQVDVYPSGAIDTGLAA